jgi:hypothetical protein
MTEKRTLNAVRWVAGLALVPLCAIGNVADASTVVEDVPVATHGLAAHVRAANERFKNVSAALSEGYTPIPCTSGADAGAMGIHYVNAKLIGDTVDIGHPQAVMYEPMPAGKLALIAVEYITTKGPASLEGQLFNFTGAPNRYGLGPFYELHVWAWRGNPHGSFADMNPKVSCEYAPAK